MIKALDRKVKKFEPGKRYIFDSKTYEKDMNVNIKEKREELNVELHWSEEIDKKEVRVLNKFDAIVGGYCLDPNWCKEIIEVKEEKQQPLTYTIGELFNLKGMF